MKKIYISILALFLFLAGQAQITVTLGSALLQNAGTNVHLPLTVKGLNGQAGGTGITGIELHINYANAVLSYDTTLNFSSQLPASQWFYGANSLEYGTNWLEPSGSKVNIQDNTVLFEIVFHYLGGPTELTFDTTRCLLADSLFNPITGVHYVNGVITPSQGSGDSRWNGTGPWNTATNWSNGIPGDSTNAIIETGIVTVFSNAVCKSITINPGSATNLSPGFSMTVNRNYTNNGTLTVQSDATGTGSLIVRGITSGTGVNNFNRYLDFSPGGAYFVSSPVSGATISVFDNNIAEKYIESSASWTTMVSSENLENGVGYRINGSAPATFTMQGLFSTGDVNRSSLSYNSGGQAETRGLNLLGNPYPSAIQWEQGSWGRENLDHAVYVWDEYKYVTWNGSTGSLTDGIIPAMQGFFVKSQAAGASLTIPADARMHSVLPFYKETEEVANVISMKIENTTDTSHFDEAFVQILNGSTSGFDGSYDAYKLTGNSAYPQIFLQSTDQTKLSISAQPEFTSVPVEYQVGTAGAYKIIFGRISSFNPGQPLFFEDKTTNTVINIRNTGEFVFTSDGSAETGRFVLHFLEVGVNEHEADAITAWNSENAIRLISNSENCRVIRLDILNMKGQLVYSAENLELPATIQQDNLTNGLFILKIQTTAGVYIKKLLVKQTR
jgi:hypothetical protein